MKFFGALGIIMGLFLIASILFVFCKEKDSRKKIIVDICFYITTGIILLICGILSFINMFEFQGLILTAIMLITLIIFLSYTTISDKRGKKIVKYKSTGRGKNKRLVETHEKFEDKK